MSNTIGRFGFDIYGGAKPKPGVIPTSPVVILTLKRWTTTRNETPAISPELVTEAEIDAHVTALKADLDATAAAAKTALKKRRSN